MAKNKRGTGLMTFINVKFMRHNPKIQCCMGAWNDLSLVYIKHISKDFDCVFNHKNTTKNTKPQLFAI